MKPQENEPCANCQHWHDATGCKENRYQSAALVIFGYCGFQKPKTETETPETI
ncbi:MAG: hypothetical protein II874_04040 [Bacteroidales bacterium]|nr:hypothetical protein [Bacteroidales bacterium]